VADRALAPLAAGDLRLRLRAVDRALDAAVRRRAERNARLRTEGAPVRLAVTADHAQRLVAELGRASGAAPGEPPLEPTAAERAARLALRARAATLRRQLPMDRLAAAFGLGGLDLAWLSACVAPELDTAYERVFGFVVDDMGRLRPSVELLLELASEDPGIRLALRPALSRFGPLRRNRILEAAGDAPTELRQELRLRPGVLDLLLGAPIDVGALAGDPEAMAAHDVPVPPGADPERVAAVARALAAGDVRLVGVWGRDDARREATVLAVAHGAGLRLRRCDPLRFGDALQAAAVLGAMLWVDVDALAGEESGDAARALTAGIAASGIPICLAGATPWRPAAVLASRPYAELELRPLDHVQRHRLWSDALPELTDEVTGDLAASFRIGMAEVRAAASMARTEARVSGNGRPLPVEQVVHASSSAVARRRSYRFATVITPRRTAEDLVLPAELHAQVLEIASFFRAWPRICRTWGFGGASHHGVRAMFCGEPGTGKTLAAEVIAEMLELDLLKVDLARVVSKWVGETEKNLEAAFAEAEASPSVLFFDEADSLFGKRGEVRHGADRYANLEAAYLLQRLEAFDGLVVLATNLRQSLDDAFTRRFDVILQFQRPALEERRRMWGLAFPAGAPAGGLDLDELARLDLTGAGIAATARNAALLAADQGAAAIETRHVAMAAARQFRREGRVLPASVAG
jgi:AAA+ superfamily predicted ATPase